MWFNRAGIEIAGICFQDRQIDAQKGSNEATKPKVVKICYWELNG